MNESDSEYRPPFFHRRWVWAVIAAAVIAAGWYIVDRQSAPLRDAGVMQERVRALEGRYAALDQEFATRIGAHWRNVPFTAFGPEEAMDGGTRLAARQWVAGAIAIVDDVMAKHGRVAPDLIAQIEQSRAPDRMKKSMIDEIHKLARRDTLALRTMRATRAYGEKIGEMAAYLDRNAQGIQLREGRLEFDDAATGEGYNQYEHQLERIRLELNGLQRQAER